MLLCFCSHSRSPPALKPPPPPAERSPPLHREPVHQCEIQRGRRELWKRFFSSLGCTSCPRGCGCSGTFLSASPSTLKQQQQKEEEGVRKQTQEMEEEPSWWGSTFYSPGRVQECGTKAPLLPPGCLTVDWFFHPCVALSRKIKFCCHATQKNKK